VKYDTRKEERKKSIIRKEEVKSRKTPDSVFLLSEMLENSCAGNFALRARCKLRGERPSTHGRDAVSYLYEMIAYFCAAKLDSENKERTLIKGTVLYGFFR